MSACPECEPDNPAARVRDRCARHNPSEVAALTAEVERLRAQRDEAVALLREPLGDPGSYQRQRWVERRDALLAAVAPQEES